MLDIEESEKALDDIYFKIDSICLYNSEKVLKAFQKNQISEAHFNTTTGYGYNDIGRDKIEDVYKDIFKSEDALVRNQFISGSHALTVALFALLRPNDKILSITGTPYDTLHEVIGIKENDSSLKSYGIIYDEIELLNNDFDYDKIIEKILNEKIKVIYIQRSRGYFNRDSISIDKLEKLITKIKKINSDIIVMIDNCYCEFVDKKEPTEVEADIVVGSLIKNLGGTIATNGAYIVGRECLIKLCAERLNVPGQGKEVGPSLGANKFILQGISMAPSVVSSALKTVVLTSYLMEKLNYKVSPRYNEDRADIVQMIEFNDEDKLIKFCRGIQKNSLIDSKALLLPCDMPGYDNKIIMASGSFTQGSSIELSCDGPLRSPYIAYLQGSMTYEYGKLGIINAIKELNNE